jgi:hypothetical protein
MVFERSHRCINLIWSVGRCSTAFLPRFGCQIRQQSTATANEDEEIDDSPAARLPSASMKSRAFAAVPRQRKPAFVQTPGDELAGAQWRR